MKRFIKFLFVLGVILGASAILAPILYDHLPIRFKFERIFNRLVMIFTLIAVALFVRVDKKTFLTRYGFEINRMRWHQFIASCCLAMGVLAVLVAAILALGHAKWALKAISVGVWGYEIMKAFTAAILIGLIEEFFFRGFLYFQINKILKNGVWPSIFVTNLIYAILHFVGDKRPFIGPDPTIKDSLRLMLAPIQSMASWQDVWPGAVGLFIFGVILNRIFVQTGSLWGAVGLHAGAVFFVKMDGFFLFVNPSNLLYGSGDLYDGVLGWGFLILLGILIEKWVCQRKTCGDLCG